MDFLSIDLATARRKLASLIAAAVLATAAAVPPVLAEPPADLAGFLVRAIDGHPALVREEAEIAARREAVRVAGALPDLRVAWGEMIVPVETRVGPQQRIFSVSQSLPWFGTLGRRARSAGAEVEAASAERDRRRYEVLRDVRRAWYGLALLQEEERIALRSRDLLARTETAVRAAYESGAGRYRDLLGVQMELGRLDVRLADLRDRREPALAALNAAAGIDADTPVPAAALPPASILAGELAVRPDSLLHAGPTLESARRRLAARRAGLETAARSGAPSLTLGLDYIMTGEASNPELADSGRDPVIARLAVNVPVWGGRSGAEERAAAARVRAAGAMVSDVRLDLEAQLADLLYRWRGAGRDLRLHESTLLPRARQNLDIVSAGYRSGGAEFAELMAAQRQLLDVELGTARARAQRVLALNELTALLGVGIADLAPALVDADPGSGS